MTLLDALFSKRAFFLRNEDTGQELQGQFPAQNVSEKIGSKYSSENALNRQSPIRQFINGELETITFQAMFFNRDDLFGSAKEDLDLLKSWSRRDSKLKRPPLISFSIGDGHISMSPCVIDSLNLQYLDPSFFGKLKGVTCDITISKYTAYSLDNGAIYETRYHSAKERDYYELIAWQEYRSAELGDVIRKRHPNKPVLQTGDVVKLPSIEAIRTERIEQKSDILKTAFGRKDTPQRALRILMFEKRNRPYTSHII
jgi:hypothetical protein